MDICEASLSSAKWCWHKIREARGLDLHVGEESMTDFFLLRLAKLARKQIRIKSFTRIEEGSNGSDWEWWFVGKRRTSIGMRIQAKIISPNNHFKHLHYIGRKSVGHRQVELLIDDARDHNLVPMYCLYCYWPRGSEFGKAGKLLSPISSHGVSLLRASYVVHGGSNALEDIANELVPLHRIFCNESFDDLVGVVSTALAEFAFITENESRGYRKEYDELPWYVRSMLSSQSDFNPLEQITDVRLQRVVVSEQLAS